MHHIKKLLKSAKPKSDKQEKSEHKATVQGENLIDLLPLEIKFLIFAQLEFINDLAKLAGVSKQWRDETSDAEMLWTHFGFKARTGQLQSAVQAYKSLAEKSCYKTETIFLFILGKTHENRNKLFHLKDAYNEWFPEYYEGNFSTRALTVGMLEVNGPTELKLVKSRIDTDINLKSLNRKFCNETIVLLPVVEDEEQVISYLREITNSALKPHLLWFIAEPNLAKKLQRINLNSLTIAENDTMLTLFDRLYDKIKQTLATSVVSYCGLSKLMIYDS